MTDDFPFLSPITPRAPERLMEQARALPAMRVALVNAGADLPLKGLRETVEAGLAEPILIGDEARIRATAERIGWDISQLRLIHAPKAAAAQKAAELVLADEADSIMKGQIHTSTLLKTLLSRATGLRGDKDRCGHVFHITAPHSDRPLLLTDGALNVGPDIPTRQACLQHAVRLAAQLGIERPKAGILSANEDPIPSLRESMEAREIADWAKEAMPQADVTGPMALDLIFSKAAAAAKDFESPVAGDADIILTPDITTGNALFKLMMLGMGCCCAGVVLGAKVPILLTSRAQSDAARIASTALGVIAAEARP